MGMARKSGIAGTANFIYLPNSILQYPFAGVDYVWIRWMDGWIDEYDKTG